MTGNGKHKNRTVRVREMRVDDIPVVYRLGHRLFQTHEALTLYRTWDAYEVTHNFNQDPACLWLPSRREVESSVLL
jgi:hypothetical protein